MTNRSKEHLRLILAFWTILAVAFSTLVQPAAAQEVDDLFEEDAEITVASEFAGPIPGMYSIGSYGQASVGLDLDPATGLLWSAENSEVHIYDHNGQLSGGSFNGFTGANAIAISGSNVYITDVGENNRVWIVDRVTREFITSFGGDALSAPCGIEVIGNRIFVASVNSNEIAVFSPNGALVDVWDGADSGTVFNFSSCGDALSTHGGQLFIADNANNRVVVYNSQGDWIRNIPLDRPPTALDIAAGHMWITSYSTDRLSKWTVGGSLVAEIQLSGAGQGQLDGPVGIVADPAGDTIWVGEFFNSRIQVFTQRLCVGSPVTRVGTSYADTFNGTNANDVVHLGAGNDTFFALDGDDKVCGGSGSDRIDGGDGADKLYGDGNGDIVIGGNGDDVLRGGSRSDRLYGGPGRDRMYGDDHADLMYGSSGNDYMFGGFGADRIFGQGGWDKLYGEGNNDKVYGGGGNDLAYGGGGEDRMWGEAGNDTIFGQSGNDSWLDGGDHNDKVYGGNGNDIIRGGDGRDKVYGQNGTDDVRAQAGDDWVTDGGADRDSCQVAPGVDVPAINCES